MTRRQRRICMALHWLLPIGIGLSVTWLWSGWRCWAMLGMLSLVAGVALGALEVRWERGRG